MESLIRPEPQKIRSMFGAVAQKYDRANTVLSGGIHHLWRKKLVQLSAAGGGDCILDCATGTGDLAIAFKKQVGIYGKVVGIDFTPEMLELARPKARKFGQQIDFQTGDVTALSFADNTFHITSISFGIRNVHDPVKALQEMARVTRPGGKVMILEFGQPNFPVWKQVYRLYSERVLPKLGGMITGKEEAYNYLNKSAAKFPAGDAFVELAQSTGAFSQIKVFPLSGGIAYVYEAVVNPTHQSDKA